MQASQTNTSQILDVKQTIAQNKRMIYSMAAQLRYLDEQVQKLEEENASLRQDKKQASYQLSYFAQYNQDLTDQVNKQHYRAGKVEEQLYRATSEIERLSAELYQRAASREQEKQISELYDRNLAYQQQMQQNYKYYAELYQAYYQAQYRLAYAQAQHENATKEAARFNETCELLTYQKNAIYAYCDSAGAQISSQRDYITDLYAQIQVLTQQKQLKDDQLLQLDSDFEKLTTKLDYAEFQLRKFEKYEQQLVDKDRAIADYYQQIQQVYATVQKYQAQAAQQVSALAYENQTYISAKNYKIAQLAELNQQLLAENYDLQARISELDGKATCALLQDEFYKQIEEMQRKIAHLESVNKQSQATIMQLQPYKTYYEALRDYFAALKSDQILMLYELGAIQVNIEEEHKLLKNHSGVQIDEKQYHNQQATTKSPAKADSKVYNPAEPAKVLQAQHLDLLMYQSQAKDEQINQLRQYNANVYNNIVSQIEELRVNQSYQARQDYQLSANHVYQEPTVSPQFRRSRSADSPAVYVPKASQQSPGLAGSSIFSQSYLDIFPKSSQIYNILNNFDITDLKQLIKQVYLQDVLKFISSVIKMTIDEIVANWNVSNEVLTKQELFNYFAPKRIVVKRKTHVQLYESDMGDDGFLVFCMGMLYFALSRGEVYYNGGKTVFEIYGLKVLIIEE